VPEKDQNGPRYEVHGSGVIAKRLRQIQRQAAQEGRGEEVLGALKRIHRELQRNPNHFGEPLDRLSGLRMQIRTGVLGPVLVDFAVCEDRPLVFIKGVKLLSARG
jgi:hypothetical protein